MDQELIQKFFRNACTAAEAEAVAEYLHTFPEILHQYLPEEEWAAYIPPCEPQPAIAERMLQVIEKAASTPDDVDQRRVG